MYQFYRLYNDIRWFHSLSPCRLVCLVWRRHDSSDSRGSSPAAMGGAACAFDFYDGYAGLAGRVGLTSDHVNRLQNHQLLRWFKSLIFLLVSIFVTMLDIFQGRAEHVSRKLR